MGYAELIQQRLQGLTPEKQAAVFDFVEFIAARTPGAAASADWTPEEFSSLSLAQALRGMEADPVSYHLDDIKERWQ